MLIALDDMKRFLGIPLSDTLEDAEITESINAAVAFLVRVRPDKSYANPSPDVLLALKWLTQGFYENRGAETDSADTAGYGFGSVPGVSRDTYMILGLFRNFPPAVA